MLFGGDRRKNSTINLGERKEPTITKHPTKQTTQPNKNTKNVRERIKEER